MKRIIVAFLMVSLGFVSCVPEPIEINVESAPEKMVVYSHVIPDNAMVISLTKSFSLLDGVTADQYNSLLLGGATVKVSVDGQEYDFFELSPGIYASFTDILSNAEQFDLIAYYNGDTIRATTQTSEKVDFTDVLPEVDKQPSDTTVSIRMQFQDVAGEENFYMINVYSKNSGANSDFDAVNYFSNGNNNLEETILLSDLEFDQSYDVKHTFDGIAHDDSVVVTLSNISESYYKYLVLRSESGSLFNQLNLEPLSYPTNVENGYGFFNAHSPDIRFYDMSDF